MSYLKQQTVTLEKYRVRIPNIHGLTKKLLKLVREFMLIVEPYDNVFRCDLSPAFCSLGHLEELNQIVLVYVQALIKNKQKIERVETQKIFYYASKESPLEIHVKVFQCNKEQNLVFFLKRHNERRILSLIILDHLLAGYPFFYDWPEEQKVSVDERLKTRIAPHLQQKQIQIDPYSIMEWKVAGQHIEDFWDKSCEEYGLTVGKILAITESFAIEDIITNTKNVLIDKIGEGQLQFSFIDAVELFSSSFNLASLKNDIIHHLCIPESKLDDIYRYGRLWFKRLLQNREFSLQSLIEECHLYNVTFNIDNKTVNIAQKLQDILELSQKTPSAFPS